MANDKDGEIVQCRLERTVDGKDQYQYSWIPVRYARVGKVLRLKNGDQWEAGWRVAETYGHSTYDHVRYLEKCLRDYGMTYFDKRRNNGERHESSQLPVPAAPVAAGDLHAGAGASCN